MASLKADKAKAASFDSAVSKTEAPTLTDAGNAMRLFRQDGKSVRWVAEFGMWHIWDRLKWAPDRDGAIVRRTMACHRAIYAEAVGAETPSKAAAIAKHARQSESRRAIEAAICLLKSFEGITISQSTLDADRMLLCAGNGYINLRTGKLTKPDRERYVTKCVPVDFDALAECPQWQKFLEEVTGGDAELIAYLHRLVGYLLTGETGEQILAFLYGTGANGKSTFLVTLRELLGPYAIQSPAETLLARRDGGINNDIARLRGARLVSCVETEDGKRFAEALVKQLTGGDPVTARFLHQEFFEFIPEFKILLAANHRPIIRGDDGGIWRRIHLVPFTVTIPPERRDKALPAKLRAELPGILAWAVRGCLEWQRIGLRPPAAVLDATQHYREDMDLIGAWIAERCVMVSGVKVQATHAFNDYSKWVTAMGAKPMSQMSFSRKLEDRGFEKRKQGVVNFHGIGLVAEDAVSVPELAL